MLISFIYITIATIFVISKYRSWIKIFNNSGPFGDGSTYLFLHQFWLKSKFGDHDSRALLGTRPVVEGGIYFKYLRFFSMDQLIKKPWLPNFILFSLLLIIMIYGGFSLEFLPLKALPFCLTIFFANPDFLSKDKYRFQFFNIQPRYLGVFLGGIIYFLILFNNQITQNINEYLFYFVLFVVNYCFLDISVFSRQVYFFIFIPCSLFSGNPSLIFSLIIPYFVKMVNKQFRYKFQAQIKYHFQYFKNRDNFFSYKKRLTSNKFLDLIINTIFSFFAGTTRQLIDYLPSIAVIIFLSCEDTLSLKKWIIIFPVLVSLLFSIRLFAFMGEGWRYLSFTQSISFPILFFLFLQSDYNQQIKICIITIFIFFTIKNYFSQSTDKNQNNEIFEILKSSNIRPPKRNIYCIPYRLCTAAVAMGHAGKTTEFQFGHDDEDYYNEYFKFRPILNTKRSWIKETNINLVLTEKSLNESWKKYASHNFIDCMEKIKESKNYILYSFNFEKYIMIK